ncbi:serpin family protein [Histomonas meleagridis]|uniref:serpin family protein n=1 Tax=Histomonas meleagridis TaxID=135588 RepID=UPI00355A9489|nr:serpin family protein [Histomonas meleagridis]KAH0799544.1 serpin family protein [Histomonas meleagridis]
MLGKKAIILQDPLQSLSLYMLSALGDESSNVVVSPYSAFATLLMVASISKDSTRKQVLDTLKMGGDISVENLLTSLRNLMQTIEKETPNGIVQGANSLWPNKNLCVDMSVYSPLIEHLGIEIVPVEFPQPGCDIINQRIEEITHGLIQRILNPSDMSQDTETIITNAIYFNAKWRKPFQSRNTHDNTFTLLNGTHKTTKFMFQKSKFFYCEDSSAQVLSMDYVNNFSMVVILPKQNDANSIRALKSSLSSGKYQTYVDMLGPKEVEVTFPKFKHTWGTKSLREMFQKMGINDLFDSRIEERYISDILQKAVIDVDEERTEAAAATVGIVAMSMFIPEQPTRFTADHPFLYFVTHNNGTILFAGEYIEPEE